MSNPDQTTEREAVETRMTTEEIVRHVIADARLEDQTLNTETIEIVRKIAHGEMTYDEIEEWKRTKVLEIREEAAKEQLKLKYLPYNFDVDRVDEYERYLALPLDDQTAFLKPLPQEELEFWIALEVSRSLYKDPVDRNPGSITEDKVAAYPERYGWQPLTTEEAALIQQAKVDGEDIDDDGRRKDS